MEDVRTILANAFCANGMCGGDQSSAPCERALTLADITLDALEDAGLSESRINGILNDLLIVCDGYCQE